MQRRHTRSWWPAWAPFGTCSRKSVQVLPAPSTLPACLSPEASSQGQDPHCSAQPCVRQQASWTVAEKVEDTAVGVPELLTQLRGLQLSISKGALPCNSQRGAGTKSPQLAAARPIRELLHTLQEQQAPGQREYVRAHCSPSPSATCDLDKVSRCNDIATASASLQHSNHAAGPFPQDIGSTSGSAPGSAHVQSGADQTTKRYWFGSHPTCEHEQAASGSLAPNSASAQLTPSSSGPCAATRRLLLPAALYGKQNAATSIPAPVPLTTCTHGQQSVASQQALHQASKTASIFESGVLPTVVGSRNQQPLTSNAAFRAQFLSVIPDASCQPLQPAALTSTLSSSTLVQGPSDQHDSGVQSNRTSDKNVLQQLPRTQERARPPSPAELNPLMTISNKAQVCLVSFLP